MHSTSTTQTHMYFLRQEQKAEFLGPAALHIQYSMCACVHTVRQSVRDDEVAAA